MVSELPAAREWLRRLLRERFPAPRVAVRRRRHELTLDDALSRPVPARWHVVVVSAAWVGRGGQPNEADAAPAC
jgi:hypothetical protein